MGKRGPPPKPTTIKILEGNPGKRPLNTREPRAERTLPDPPKSMKPENKREWRKWAKILLQAGVATQLDSIAFGLLIGALVKHQEAADNVAKYGPVWMEKGDSAIPKFQYSPWWVVQNREFDKLKGLLAEFGMTPSARSRVLSNSENQQPDNPLLELMKRRDAKRKA
jgi:P27 family predicted phage terminase small subunit